jgi:hypothetical protein
VSATSPHLVAKSPKKAPHAEEEVEERDYAGDAPVK